MHICFGHYMIICVYFMIRMLLALQTIESSLSLGGEQKGLGASMMEIGHTGKCGSEKKPVWWPGSVPGWVQKESVWTVRGSGLLGRGGGTQ